MPQARHGETLWVHRFASEDPLSAHFREGQIDIYIYYIYYILYITF